MNRRDFLVNGLLVIGALAVCPVSSLAAADHVYKSAPLSMLPDGLRNASPEIRDAYRFAVLNWETLRYIPCYCGCGNDGHTSNASCYVKDDSPHDKPEFDSMSIGWTICMGITRDVMKMMDQGKRLKEIRAYIEKTYSKNGPPTPTPAGN